ncbi:MAG: hypothetical protein ACJ8AO_03700 [Gemmatimonadaceae bacterium]
MLATIALAAPAPLAGEAVILATPLAVVGGLGLTAVTTPAGGAIGVAMREAWAAGRPPR